MPHTCDHVQVSRNANSKWIAKKTARAIDSDMKLKPKSIPGMVIENNVINPSYMTCYRAKRDAIKIMHGKEKDGWSHARQFLEHFEDGTSSVFETKKCAGLDGEQFRRLFVFPLAEE